MSSREDYSLTTTDDGTRAYELVQISGNQYAYVLESGVSFDDVFTASSDNTLRSTSISDGSLNWTFNGFSSTVFGVSVSPDGTVVYGGSAFSPPEVKSINVDDQSTNWTFTGHGHNVIDVAASADGTQVFTASEDETVKALAVSDGSENWSIDDSGFPSAIVSGPDGDFVYHGNQDGRMVKSDATDGSQEWKVNLHGGNTIQRIAVTPDGVHLYSTADFNNSVKKSKTSDGSEVWDFSLDTTGEGGGEHVDGSVYYATDFDGDVYAINDDGTEKWKVSSIGAEDAAGTDDGTSVLVSRGSGGIRKLAASDGSTEWNATPHSDTIHDLSAGAEYG